MLQEIVSVAVQNVQYMENIIKEPNKNGTIGSSHSNGNDPYKQFVSITLFFNKSPQNVSGFIQGIIYFPVQLFHLPFPLWIFCNQGLKQEILRAWKVFQEEMRTIVSK